MAVTTQQIGPYNFGYGNGGSSWTYDTEHTADANTLLLLHLEDNAASTTITDSSGNSYNATASENTNGCTTASGKFGRGFFSDPADINYITIGTAALKTAYAGCLTSGNSTIEMWFKCDDADWSTNSNMMLWQWYIDGNNYFGPYFYSTGNTWNLTLHSGGTNSDTILTTAPAYVDDTDWHHYAITINKTTDELKFFIDGSLIKTVTSIGDWSGTGGTFILFDNWDHGGTYEPDGNFDEVAISNVIRYT